MVDVVLWNFNNGLCYSLLEDLPSNKPHRRNIWVRKGIFGKELLSDIPESSVLTIDSSKCPGLGRNLLKIILSDRSGESPVLEAINISIGALHEALSRSKESEEAAIAGKEVEAWQVSQTAEQTINRELEKVEKLKRATQPEGIPMGARRRLL
jgi:hypothetical protein